jgi:hypothetical protein
MRDLAATGSHGAHRLPLTDLTVTVAAQAAAVDILHFDQHLERLGEHLGIETHWISDRRDEARYLPRVARRVRRRSRTHQQEALKFAPR